MRRTAIAATFLLASLAACGTPEDEGDIGADENEAFTETPGAPAHPDTLAAGPDNVQVTLAEWTVGAAPDTVDAGRITFEVMNAGDYPHILEVEGQGIEQETDTIPAGGRTTLQADLQPGEYELYCPLVNRYGNHSEQGMRTRLVVR